MGHMRQQEQCILERAREQIIYIFTYAMYWFGTYFGFIQAIINFYVLAKYLWHGITASYQVPHRLD